MYEMIIKNYNNLQDSQLRAFLNNYLHRLMLMYPLRQLKVHRIFVLSDARNHTYIVTSHFEQGPWRWKFILLSNLLLLSNSIYVVVKLFLKSDDRSCLSQV